MQPRFLSRTGTVLWIGALSAAVCVMPHAIALMPNSLSEASARIGQPIPVVIALSTAHSAIVLAILTYASPWAARRVGMGAPPLDAWLGAGTWPSDLRRGVLYSILLGAASGVVIVLLDIAIFAPIGSKGLAAGSRPTACSGCG